MSIAEFDGRAQPSLSAKLRRQRCRCTLLEMSRAGEYLHEAGAGKGAKEQPFAIQPCPPAGQAAVTAKRL